VEEVDRYPTADGMMSLLGYLAGSFGPGERGRVDTLTHSLQTATRAERSGADGPLLVAALCHDAGKVFSDRRHGQLSASMLSGYVPPDVVRAIDHHVDLTARSFDPEHAVQRHRFRHTRWYAIALRLVEEWDVPSFDPDFEPEPLSHFEPLLRDVLAKQRWPDVCRLPARLEPLRGAADSVRRMIGWG
jgi:predicted HD phosphohydrolase